MFFRLKKPIPVPDIEGRKYDGSDACRMDIMKWAGPHAQFINGMLMIMTRHGDARCYVGMYVIKSAKNEWGAHTQQELDRTHEVAYG